jgi:glutamate/aspartate transport system substrate-binding protein
MRAAALAFGRDSRHGRAGPTGTLKKIKDSGTITLGNRETSVPFSYLDDKQQPIGYSMDICAAIVEE